MMPTLAARIRNESILSLSSGGKENVSRIMALSPFGCFGVEPTRDLAIWAEEPVVKGFCTEAFTEGVSLSMPATNLSLFVALIIS